MPFDGSEISPVTRRRMLANALREAPPENFTWEFGIVYRNYSSIVYRNYSSCGVYGCAIGWAHVLWPELNVFDVYMAEDLEGLGKLFGMTTRQVARIFFGETKGGRNYYKGGYANVTPRMVANALDKLDRKKKA